MSERQPPPAEPGPDVLDLRVSPAVDRLLGVTDSRDVAELIPRQQADQVQLDAVGVLELVHEEVSKSLAAAGAKLGYALQRIDDREDEVIEVAQAPVAERVLIGAVDQGQDLDRLELSLGGAFAAGSIRRRPVDAVQLGRALLELVGPDASTLELEHEAQAGPQQAIKVLDSERGERIRVERCCRAAAQPCDQPRLEQALASVVQNAKLARCADQVGELVEQPRAGAVEGADPRAVHHLRAKLRLPAVELVGDALSQLVRGAVVERDGQDPVGRHAVVDQPAEPLGRRERLSSAWPGGDEESTIRSGVGGRRLLGAERAKDCAHSGGCPP